MGRLTSRHARWRRNVRQYTTIVWLVLLFCMLVIKWNYGSCVAARVSLQRKYASTDFDKDMLLSGWMTAQSQFMNRHQRERLLAARKEWRLLGSGWEGVTYSWNGSAIKRFNAGRSPFRNCLHSDLKARRDQQLTGISFDGEYWPTEIPAMLLTASRHGFVPIRDIFSASSTTANKTEWHLVTQLMEGGNLGTLAADLSCYQGSSNKTTRLSQLDLRFRPNFEHVLRTIQSLHDQGLCHDDIKLDNVFVGLESQNGSDGPWLLGDLGNVRHITHPYHTTPLWSNNNENLSDCRAADSLRALKTYLQFLRRASQAIGADDHEFNIALLQGNRPWARLLHRTNEAQHLSASQLLRWSMDDERPARDSSGCSSRKANFADISTLSSSWSFRQRRLLAGLGRRKLRISASEGSLRLVGLIGLLGLPSQDCRRSKSRHM